MDKLIARFESWLAANCPDYCASLLPGVTDVELDTFETQIGYPLAADFRALYRWRNGSPKTGLPPTFWSSWLPLEDCLSRGYGATIASFEADPGLEWHPAWLILEDEHDGNYLLFDPVGVWGGHSGQLVRWVKADYNFVKFSSVAKWLEVLVLTLESATQDEKGEWNFVLWFNPSVVRQVDPGYPKEPFMEELEDIIPL